MNRKTQESPTAILCFLLNHKLVLTEQLFMNKNAMHLSGLNRTAGYRTKIITKANRIQAILANFTN